MRYSTPAHTPIMPWARRRSLPSQGTPLTHGGAVVCVTCCRCELSQGCQGCQGAGQHSFIHTARFRSLPPSHWRDPLFRKYSILTFQTTLTTLTSLTSPHFWANGSISHPDATVTPRPPTVTQGAYPICEVLNKGAHRVRHSTLLQHEPAALTEKRAAQPSHRAPGSRPIDPQSLFEGEGVGETTAEGSGSTAEQVGSPALVRRGQAAARSPTAAPVVAGSRTVKARREKEHESKAAPRGHARAVRKNQRQEII